MQPFRKISAILFSALLLLSSASFSFGMHFCMGELESVTFFSGAAHCEMSGDNTPLSHQEHAADCDQEPTRKNCCEDNTLVLESSEDLTRTSTVVAPDFHMVAVLSVLLPFLHNANDDAHDSFKDYSPPFIWRDIPVLVQSFLI